jgi:hypothetical protein
MERVRLTIRGLLVAVFVIGIGLAFLRKELTSGNPLEVLLLAVVVYFGSPMVARVWAPRTVVFWDWFAIVGLLYLVTSLGYFVVPPPRLPTSEWLESLASRLVPVRTTDDDFDALPDLVRWMAVMFMGQFVFSLLFAFLGAIAAWVLTARQRRFAARARDLSDRILDDEPHEPMKPYPL